MVHQPVTACSSRQGRGSSSVTHLNATWRVSPRESASRRDTAPAEESQGGLARTLGVPAGGTGSTLLGLASTGSRKATLGWASSPSGDAPRHSLHKAKLLPLTRGPRTPYSFICSAQDSEGQMAAPHGCCWEQEAWSSRAHSELCAPPCGASACRRILGISRAGSVLAELTTQPRGCNPGRVA